MNIYSVFSKCSLVLAILLLLGCGGSSTSDNNSAVIGNNGGASSASTSTSNKPPVNQSSENKDLADRFKPVDDKQGSYTVEKSRTVDTTAFTDAATKMTFEVLAHDFGEIKQHTSNEFIFKFKNEGTEPLIIYDAQGSCGCTVPQFPAEPTMPGEENEIIVVYKPAKQKGAHTKTVTITANTAPKQSKLTIKANVSEIAG